VQKRAVQHHARRGLEPKLTLDKADDRVAVGSSRVIRRVPSIVLQARLRRVLLDAGADRQHERVEHDVLVAQSVIVDRQVADRVAIASFRSAVRAMAATLSSSMVPATTAAPYFSASVQMWASFSRRPRGSCCSARTARRPASGRLHDVGFVLSSMSGAGIALTNAGTTSCMSRHAVAPDEVDAHVQHVRPLAHLVARHADQPVPVLLLQSRLNCRLPLVFVRSATIR
jgi:hypothetical protein